MSPITGVAAGVPFVALPPASGSPDAPVVVAWHLLDAPCTEAAFAAALPLDGLDAWRFYLGLPLCGSRTPPGGADEVMRLGYEDAVLNLYGPITTQAAAELGPALDALRARFGVAPGPVALLGGSQGTQVVQLVLAEVDLPVAAAVLVSPVAQLRPLVEANGERFGFTYPWSETSLAMARRLDFVARAGEDPARADVPTLIVVGESDHPAGIRGPAAALHAALPGSELVEVPGMEHELAEAPGVEPAPQTPAAAAVEEIVTRFLRAHLAG